MRTAVFDLDGTLADTSADLIAAANAALGEGGFGTPLEAVADAHTAFRGGRAMLRAGLARLPGSEGGADAVIEALYPRLLEHYRTGLCRETRLYPGVEAALDRLAAEDWILAVCTNKPIALAEALLAELGIAPRFRATLGADSLPVRKPDPQHLFETIARAGGRPEGAVLIGDTETDRETARRAGLPCILVGFGPEGAGVARLAPEAMLARYDDLPGLLEAMIPRRRRAG
ncbi:MAG: HAD hydrolase-like protein [Rhodobacteraceae bacterium]|nr:HAD hydrolase-like protein [Paracoccaceae bacterium]